MEIGELLNSHDIDEDSVPIITGSAKKALGYRGNNLEYDYWQPILQLTMELTSEFVLPANKLKQETEQPFLMTVEDVFKIEGKGTVVTGTVVTGTVKRGGLAIGSPLQIIGLQDPINTACAGTIEDIDAILLEGQEENEVSKVTSEEQQIRTGFLLKNVEGKRVAKGQVLAEPQSIAAHANFEAEVYHLAMEEGGINAPLVINDRIQFDFWQADITGRVKLSEDIGIIMPGQNGSIAVELEKPVAMEIGTRFIMNKDDGRMGIGVVTEIAD